MIKNESIWANGHLFLAALATICLVFSAPAKAQTVANEPDTTFVEDGGELFDEQLDDIDVEKGAGVPAWLASHISNDTLFVGCDREVLPRKLVIHTNNGDVIYKVDFRFMVGDTSLLYHHPCDSVYKNIWTDAHVNPYGNLFDSLKEDVHIPMKGFCLPAPGYITSHYGWRRYRMHKGTDIKVQIGDSIRSAWGGQVRIVGWDPRGYGYYVVVRHDNGLETVYGHMSRPMVDQYEKVFPGDVIGLGGNTGRSTGSHLHWEIRYLGRDINPEAVVDFTTGQLKNKEEYVIGIKAIRQQEAERAAMRFHTVRQGDTLSAISRRYHVSVKRLCQLNKIKETSILRLGQKIRVN